jgi:hypothetical protein
MPGIPLAPIGVDLSAGNGKSATRSVSRSPLKATAASMAFSSWRRFPARQTSIVFRARPERWTSGVCLPARISWPSNDQTESGVGAGATRAWQGGSRSDDSIGLRENEHSSMRSIRSQFVVATTRTSMPTVSELARRWSSRSCKTRNNLPCKSSGRSPISSRNMAPPFACSNLPMRLCKAPVNAPRA